MEYRLPDDADIQYKTCGYVVFRRILPALLIDDLRVATDELREIARSVRGAQTQRIEPIWDFDIDIGPFERFAALLTLRDAVCAVLSPRHATGVPKAVLLEPGSHSYAISWHRDWRDNTGVDKREWAKVANDVDYFNQINAALYEDSSLWIVPSSHDREDLPGEHEAFVNELVLPLDGLTEAQRERRGLEYCESMPGATRVFLEAGDVLIYRNTLWHTGTYVPYRKRATLHGFIDTPAFAAWRTRMVGDDERPSDET